VEPMIRRTLTIAITAVFLGMALAGCATNNGTNPGNTTTTTTSPTSGGTGVKNPDVFTTLTISEAESLDPAYDYESAGGQILQNVYNTLYFYKGSSATDLVPVLASAMPNFSADKKEVTIPLRADAKFHDGNLMTADDVVFSLNRVILMNDPDGPAAILNSVAGATAYNGGDGSAAARTTYLAAGGITKVDDHTVKIKLDYPDPALLYKLAFTLGSVVEKSYVCAHKGADFGADCLPPPGKTRDPWMDEHEMGTGAFMLDSWQKGQQLSMKRWDQFFGTKALVSQVIVKKVDDVNTRELALFSGDADDVYIPVDHAGDLQGKSGLRIVENDSFTVAFIGFNQHFCGDKNVNLTAYTTCMATNGVNAPKGANGAPDTDFFADKNMRLAWINAFDYDQYINDILGHHGSLLNGVIPKGMFGYDSSIPVPHRDMTKAKDYYSKSNHSDGFTLTIFYNTGNTVREKTAELLAQNLAELGPNIHVDTKGLDFSTAFLAAQRAKALPVFYLGWAPDYAFPDDYTTPFADSQAGVYAKRVGYANPAMDDLLHSLLRETDQTKLQQGYSQVTKMLNDDAAYIFLAQASAYHVERDWVHGFYFNPMQNGAPNVGDFSTVSKQ